MEYVLALLVTVFGWWFSTGLILTLNHLPSRTHRWSMVLLTVLCLGAVLSVTATSQNTTQVGALLAFGQALLIWGWLEMGYLMGFVTGPSNRACPPGVTGWSRFGLALQTSLYHECLVVIVVFGVVALTAGAPNQVTALCCVVLWLMRWSAKLNLFLGVAQFHADWLPENQRHLVSYMKRRRLNALLPVSLVLGIAFSAYFLVQSSAGSNGVETFGSAIVGLLLALGVLEHLFLVMPMHDAKLWQWALPGRPSASCRADPSGSQLVAGQATDNPAG